MFRKNSVCVYIYIYIEREREREFGSVVVLGSTRVSWHISPLDKGGLLYRLYKEKIPSV